MQLLKLVWYFLSPRPFKMHDSMIYPQITLKILLLRWNFNLFFMWKEVWLLVFSSWSRISLIKICLEPWGVCTLYDGLPKEILNVTKTLRMTLLGKLSQFPKLNCIVTWFNNFSQHINYLRMHMPNVTYLWCSQPHFSVRFFNCRHIHLSDENESIEIVLNNVFNCITVACVFS